MKPRFLFAALALAYASHAGTTFAQAFLSDPRLVEGRGIKAGNFELHPGIAVAGGYDSNYFQGAGTENGVTALNGAQVSVREPVIDAWRLQVTPSFSMLTRGVRASQEGGGPLPDLTLAAHADASYNALWANQSQYSSYVTNQDDVGVSAGAALNVFPARTWGGDLGAEYNRIIEASNDPTVSNAWKRDNIRGTAGISFRPGGGLFSVRVGYQANVTLFESSGFQTLNNIVHSLQLGSTWKFLPRTALVYRGNITWLEYTDTRPQTLGTGQTFDSQIGLNGLISNYFGLLGMIGWAGTFYNTAAGTAQNFDSVIGQAQLTWYPNPQNQVPGPNAMPVGLSSVALGYTRSFGPSYLGTYFQQDRGYLNTVYFFGQRFVASLAGGLSHVTRPASFFANVPATAAPGQDVQSPGSGENRVDGVAFLEYRLSTSVGVNTTFRYDAELDHRVYQIAFGSPTGDDLKFNRYQILLGARWFL
ncbi:MAG TPA: hypothetical protein VG710_08430 [Opitutus sp.]|nr:hypothetical protein [Polyangiaceae bacterium]HWA86232.1 hypothetical protein [Opitutus sp.]